MGLRVVQWGSLLALGVFSILVGSFNLAAGDLWNMAWFRLLGLVRSLAGSGVGAEEFSRLRVLWEDQLEMKWEILMISRIPRLCSILVAGSSLAITGLIMQRITNNRFVSPTTAGTMEWCRFGVMIAILYFPDASPFWRVGAAFLVSLVGTSCFLGVIARVRHGNVILVPLIGMMLGGVVNAGATFYAYQYDIVQNMASWLQGSFALVIEGNYELLYAGIPLMILAYLYADLFTIAGMGRTAAVALGLNHAGIMRVGLVIVSIISSITIVEVGYLPFIGLIVPNIVSIFRGDAVRKILFDTAWLGAVLVLVCDVAGRMIIPPFEIPIGVILSVVGGVVFLSLILNKRSYA
ncbi:MAG: iron chelate uptake ABC transporter family permease subunit [Akkermansiaceae bacterium]|nr:iron chelate uptake ABC transporter family permease subunit [Akkermansiaceae bacterium]